MAHKELNKKGAHYCRSLVQSQKISHHLLMKAKKWSSSSELHGADEKGYLSFGVVDAWHGASYGAHVGVLATLHWLSGGACRAGGILRLACFTRTATDDGPPMAPRSKQFLLGGFLQKMGPFTEQC